MVYACVWHWGACVRSGGVSFCYAANRIFVAEVSVEVFVASSADGEHHYGVFVELILDFGQEGEGMRAFESWYDAFHARELEGSAEGFVVIGCEHLGAPLVV